MNPTLLPILLLTIIAFVVVLAAATPASSHAIPTDLTAGTYDAWLDSPGGELHFGLELAHDKAADTWRGWVINGEERAEIPHVTFEDDRTLVLKFTQYNSAIRANVNADGDGLDGEWKKRQGLDTWTVMVFHATMRTAAPYDRSKPGNREDIAGRWAVDFDSSDDLAVGVFESNRLDNTITGTFLTTTGDYRFLGGSFENNQFTLSVFDGAHAFLFRADLQEDGSLAGDFWSRDVWHEAWTATRDPEAQLPDAFGITVWDDTVDADALRFRAMDGEYVSPFNARFAGKVRIIEVFGTWCHNCNDATRYMMELDEKYREHGLSILGLAFEVTGEYEEDRAQIERYVEHHGIKYPILHCGILDKNAASKAFPLLDRVRSYPTFIFLDAENKVRAIYTGFSGPATGTRYDKLREDFERIIEAMLSE